MNLNFNVTEGGGVEPRSFPIPWFSRPVAVLHSGTLLGAEGVRIELTQPLWGWTA
jgi:hypothetical protein